MEDRGIETLEDLADIPPTVRVAGLTKDYRIRQGGFRSEAFRAVDDVTFEIPRGKTLALVGESGSGKSTVAKMLLKLEEPTSGTIEIDGQDVSRLSNAQAFGLRRRMQPVFQDPVRLTRSAAQHRQHHRRAAADPRRRRPCLAARAGRGAARPGRAAAGAGHALPERALRWSATACRHRRALALKPDIVVLDEAVSALDVLVQDQILKLLADLQAELDLTYLFITHDLAVVRVSSDLVCVMEQGKVVEQGTVDEIFANPQQEYTDRLLQAIPGASITLGGR